MTIISNISYPNTALCIDSLTSSTLAIYQAFHVVTMILGIPGNILVIWINSRIKRKSPLDIIIIYMSSCDLISLLITVPMWLTDSTYLWYIYGSNWLCKARRYIDHVSIRSSALTLGVLAIERYQRVCKRKSVIQTCRAAVKVCTAVTIVTCVLAAPSWIIFGTNEHGVCMTPNYVDRKLVYAYFFTWALINFCLVAIILFSYGLIARKIFVHSKHIQRNISSDVAGKTTKSKIESRTNQFTISWRRSNKIAIVADSYKRTDKTNPVYSGAGLKFTGDSKTGISNDAIEDQIHASTHASSTIIHTEADANKSDANYLTHTDPRKLIAQTNHVNVGNTNSVSADKTNVASVIQTDTSNKEVVYIGKNNDIESACELNIYVLSPPNVTVTLQDNAQFITSDEEQKYTGKSNSTQDPSKETHSQKEYANEKMPSKGGRGYPSDQVKDIICLNKSSTPPNRDIHQKDFANNEENKVQKHGYNHGLVAEGKPFHKRTTDLILKSTNILFSVSLVYIISWIVPTVTFISSMAIQSRGTYQVHVVLVKAYYLSMFLNPVLYYFMNRQFKEQVSKLLKNIKVKLKRRCFN